MNTPARLIAIAAAVATLSLAACTRREDSQTAGQKLDGAIASAEKKTESVKADMQQGSAEVKADASNAVAQVASSAADAAITVSVNAELTRDPNLSALKINVDTVNGAVLLKGTAPSTAARERATQLAASVKGVVRVDNQLEVRG